MKKILLLGEPMCLFIANETGKLENVNEFTRRVSGAELNVAIGLTRLGYEVQYATKLGNDPLGWRIAKFLKEQNLKTDYVEFSDTNSTGIQLKSKTQNDDPEICYFRKNSAASTIDIEYVKKIDIKEFDLIHITGIPLAISTSFKEAIIEIVTRAKKENVLVSFDPNLRPSMWETKDKMIETVNYVSTLCDIVMPGIGECEILHGTKDLQKIADKYLKLKTKMVVIKDGGNGAYLIKGNEFYFKKSFKVEKIVDTVGAGDGFAVGVISALLENLEVEKLLERANAIGAIQLSNIGDNEALPTRCELEEYIQKRGVENEI